MKRNIIAVAIAGALALGTSSAFAQGPEKGGHGRGMHHGMGGNPLEHMTKDLDLTAAQQAQVAPIIENAKPQFKAIHEEAMQKAQALMESTGSQIRAILTPAQQQKFDAMKKAHQDMRSAEQEMHAARSE